MFAKETYIRRRQQLKSTLKSGLLLFLGNDECGMNYADNTYHYRQDSTFLYFFGSDYAGLAAVIDIDEDREIIFGNELTIDDIVWMGTQPSISEKSERVGISETLPMASLKSYLDCAVAKGQSIHYLPPYRGDHKLWLSELLGAHPAELAVRSSVPFIRAVVEQRNYKSAEEIAQIEEAVATSVEMHVTAMHMARPGIKESEIAAAVTEVSMRNGGNLSFPVIATINGQTLHNHCHSNVLQDGQLFLLDAGAENTMHYAGDLTSTMPVSGRFTERQRTVFDINHRAYTAAVNALKPGVPFRDVHMIAVTEICKGMKELGGKLLPVISNSCTNVYLKELATVCGITKNLTFHMARHTFATTVTLTNGVPIETVGKMLGHKHIRTTQLYAKVINEKVAQDMSLLASRFGGDYRLSSGRTA